MDQEEEVHMYTMECYSVLEKNEIMPFAATWMDLEIITLREGSMSERHKYHMLSLICGIQSMTQMSL